MGWKTLQINEGQKLGLYLNNLRLTYEQKIVYVPISDIDLLLIDNTRTYVTVKLLEALMNNNVTVVFMNSAHEPSSQLLPFQGHHFSLKVFHKQLEWDAAFRGAYWKAIVINKIANQRLVVSRELAHHDHDAQFFENERNVEHFDITNREGHAAKIYWHFLFGKKFLRNYRPADHDLINIMLNYGYAVLRATVLRSIIKKGLDPRIALFHKSYGNFFALGSDLMEPFRGIIDTVVCGHQDANLFTLEIREDLIKALTQKIILNGTLHYINNAIDIYVDNLVQAKPLPWVSLCASS